jgi:uncharacterized protein YjbJ (UPF0337 family)
MNNHIYKGKWKQVRGQAKVWWGKLTHNNREQVSGKVEKMVGTCRRRSVKHNRKSKNETERGKMTVYKDVRTTEHEPGQGQRVATFKLTQLIWLMVGLLEAVIALRVVFKLIGVNAANPFAALIYSVSNPFVAPFASL